MKKLLIVFLAIFSFATSFAQENRSVNYSSLKGENALGFGVGTQYGGIGLNISRNIVDGLAMFGGAGVQIGELGWNVGFTKDLLHSRRLSLAAQAMYGTNLVITFEDDAGEDEIYTGFTLGANIKLHSKRRQGNHWSFGLMFPIKSSEYKDDLDEIKSSSFIETKEERYVAISIGYHINF